MIMSEKEQHSLQNRKQVITQSLNLQAGISNGAQAFEFLQSPYQNSKTCPPCQGMQIIYSIGGSARFQKLPQVKAVQKLGFISGTNSSSGGNQPMADSQNSSISNISLKHKHGIGSSSQIQINKHNSKKSLSKCNSSPLNSLIRRSTSKLLHPSAAGNAGFHQYNASSQNYNSTQPYKDIKSKADPMDYTDRIVCKSNSHKSINCEGTPKNKTHLSISNKNVNTQSQKAVFSGGKIRQSNQKLLMPSGSSGTLMRKEIVEMDEVNSSSSSSIGNEKNMHQTFQASNGVPKIKIKQKELTVEKLNFTGQPFAPDSIIQGNIDQNLGDDDEGGEFENVNELSPGLFAGSIPQVQSIVQPLPNSSSESSLKKLVTGSGQQNTSKNPNSQYATNQSQHQGVQPSPSQKQSSKVPKGLKVNTNNRNVTQRVASPGHKARKSEAQQKIYQDDSKVSEKTGLNLPSKQTTSDAQATAKAKSKQYVKINPKQGPQLSSDNNKSQNNESSKFSQTQKCKVSFVDGNIIRPQTYNKTEEQKISYIYQAAERKLSSGQTGQSVKLQGKQPINKNIQSYSNIASKLESEKSQNSKKHSHLTNPSVNFMSNNSPRHQHQPSRQTPSDKMLQNSLGHYSQAKQMLSQETQLPPHSLLTPNWQNNNIGRSSNLGSSKDRNASQNFKFQPLSEKKLNAKTKRNDATNGSKRLQPGRQSYDEANLSLEYQDSSENSNNKKNVVMSRKSTLQWRMNMLNNDSCETVKEGQKDDLRDANQNRHCNDSELQDYLEEEQLSKDLMYSNKEVIPDIPQHQSSPKKTGTIPMSLAFKRKSIETRENNAQPSMGVIPSKRSGGVLKDRQRKREEKNRLSAEEEHNALSSRRQKGKEKTYVLKHKDELHRTIPFSKFSIDFSGTESNKRSAKKNKGTGCSQLLCRVESLEHVVTFMDFNDLLKVMSLVKDFREDFTNSPNHHQQQFFRVFRRQLKTILALGLPSTLQRIQYWNFRTKFFYGKKKKPNLYRTLKSQEVNDYVADIKKDVYRTFPYLTFFQPPQQGQEKLFNILNSLAQQNSKTGYIQGMNFLAGTILINLHKEEETFWMMMSILNKYKFDAILDLKNGGLFQVLCYQLEMFMQAYLPRLHGHFTKIRIPTDIYAANWFITMFCYDLSIDLVLCILDVFLLEGKKSLIRVSLALLSFLEERLMLMNYEECMVFLSHSQKDIDIDSQTLIESAFSFKITNSLLSDLELFYRLKFKSPNKKILAAFNTLTFQEETAGLGKNKLSWVIMPATPNDIEYFFKKNKGFLEEDIQQFYQDNLKHRKLREIVEEMQIEEDSEVGNVNNNPSSDIETLTGITLQASQRKKGTLHQNYAQSAHQQKRRKLTKGATQLNQKSNNTIVEQTLDYSGGGSGKFKMNNSQVTSKNSVGEISKLQIKHELSNLHSSVVMKPSCDTLVTPRKVSTGPELNKMFKQNLSNPVSLKKDTQSPFISIGTQIKSIFGNFFKATEKLNKSYEDAPKDIQPDGKQQTLNSKDGGQVRLESLQRIEIDQSRKQMRSKSIYQRQMQDSPERKLSPKHLYTNTSNQDESPYQQSANTKAFNKEKPQVTTEDCHNVPNSHYLFFNTTTHLNQLNKGIDCFQQDGTQYQSDKIAQDKGARVEKQTINQFNDNDEDCEVDLLSNSDYTIGPVIDNVLGRKNGPNDKTNASPMILIAKDLVAGETLDEKNHLSYSPEIRPRHKLLKLGTLGQIDNPAADKADSSVIASSMALSNPLKKGGIASLKTKSPLYKVSQSYNSKTMKSSPQTSPKDASNQMNQHGTLFNKGSQHKSPLFMHGKRR